MCVCVCVYVYVCVLRKKMKIMNYKQQLTRNSHETYNYLCCKSPYLKHLKVSLAYSQLIRINKICSNYNVLFKCINNLKLDFTAGGCHQNSIYHPIRSYYSNK